MCVVSRIHLNWTPRIWMQLYDTELPELPELVKQPSDVFIVNPIFVF